MASQNSELLVTNTLFIDMKFYVTQISLTSPNSEHHESRKINLCNTEILKLDSFLNQVSTWTDSIPKNKNPESILNG